MKLKPGRRPAARSDAGGFTLIEVLIAMLIAVVGLIGTVAVQQSAMNAVANVNDAQTAMRLGTSALEQFNTRKTSLAPFVDMLGPVASGDWTTPVFLDTMGRTSAVWTAANRWRLRTRVTDTGATRPYNISVEVLYSIDSGDPKTLQLDVERMKKLVSPRPRPRRRQGGLTVVELLVTLVIASVVSAATFSFFAGQQKIYDVQTEILNLQQNLWASMETLARYARVAGSGMQGCIRIDSDDAGPDLGDPGPGGATSPLTGLRVWNAATATFSRIPPLWIQNGAAGAPDRITVAYGEGASGAFRDAILSADVDIGESTDAIVLQPNETNAFRTDELALLVENSRADLDRGCSLFQITGINAGTRTLLHSSATSNYNTTGNIAAMIPFAFDGGTPTVIPPYTPTGGVRRFGTLTYVQFAVDTTTTPPRLTMNVLTGTAGPQILAEGIEDMQIAYACDRLPAAGIDGVLSEGTTTATRLADEWVYNVTADAVPIACKRPDGIRITLMARSANTDNNLRDLPGNGKPAAEDGVAGAADLFRHRVSSVTVYPRN